MMSRARGRSDGRLTHTYDARGRLVQTIVPGTPATALSFQYNGQGQRVWMWNNATGTGALWMYDDAGNMLAEYPLPTGIPKEMIWLGSTPVGVATNLPVSCPTPPCTAYGVGYVWTDHLDTPRAITNSAGAPIWHWDSAPFGDTPANQNPNGLGTFVVNNRFPGQYSDSVTGLFQNGARVYDCAIGRYIQSDPINLHAGTNTYLYARGDPLGIADPTGLQGERPGYNPNISYRCFLRHVAVGAIVGGVAGCIIGRGNTYVIVTGAAVGALVGGAVAEIECTEEPVQPSGP